MARCGCGSKCTCLITNSDILTWLGDGDSSNGFKGVLRIDPASPTAVTVSGAGISVAGVSKDPVTLTDAATITTDVSLSRHFRVTLAGNRTLGVPTNPIDGAKVIWEVIQDATGSRTLAFNAIFAFGSDIPSITLSGTANKRDFIGAIYNQVETKWYITSVVKGY